MRGSHPRPDLGDSSRQIDRRGKDRALSPNTRRERGQTVAFFLDYLRSREFRAPPVWLQGTVVIHR